MKKTSAKRGTIKDAAAVVLAGGESKRFGRDKSTAPLMEQTFTERVLEVLSPLFDTIFIGVRRKPHPLEDLVALPFIADSVDIKGPLAGIYTAMKTTTSPWLFVIACDMPLVRRELIVYLAERRDNNHCVVPVVRGKAQPLCAFYNKEALLERVEQYIRNGGRNLKDFLNSSDIKTCYVEEKELSTVDPELVTFIDIDTAQDVAVVEKILREGTR